MEQKGARSSGNKEVIKVVAVYLNHELPDAERRELLYEGELLFFSRRQSTEDLCNYAKQLASEALAPLDPETAQFQLDVPSFIQRVGPLKTKFTNCQHTKELIRAILADFDCDLEATYFDVPRLRVVPSDGYLTAGVSYAYKAHRDTWYSSPVSQINYWMPVFPIDSNRAMSIFPEYWTREIANSSSEFDYQEWCEIGRTNALNQIKTDTRKHPLPLEPVNLASELRFAGTTGDILLFSPTHLHATAPNTSGKTRFSIDFRTVHIDDLKNNRGAPLVDCRSRGTTLSDFLRASDFAQYTDSKRYAA